MTFGSSGGDDDLMERKKETTRWSWRHPAVVAPERIRPFFRLLDQLVNIGSITSYRRWQ
jgi:hypothetical protein